MKYYNTLGDALNDSAMDSDQDTTQGMIRTQRRGPNQARYTGTVNTASGPTQIDAEVTFYPDETDYNVSSVSEQEVAAFCAQNQAVHDANAGQQISQMFVTPLATYSDGTSQPSPMAITAANAIALAPTAAQANMSMSNLSPAQSYAVSATPAPAPLTIQNVRTSPMNVSNISPSNSFYNGQLYNDSEVIPTVSDGNDPSIFNPTMGDTSATNTTSTTSAVASDITNAATAASTFVTGAQTQLAPVVAAAQAQAPGLIAQFQALPPLAQAGLLVGGYLAAKKVPFYYLLAAGGLFAYSQMGTAAAMLSPPASPPPSPANVIPTVASN